MPFLCIARVYPHFWCPAQACIACPLLRSQHTKDESPMMFIIVLNVRCFVHLLLGCDALTGCFFLHFFDVDLSWLDFRKRNPNWLGKLARILRVHIYNPIFTKFFYRVLFGMTLTGLASEPGNLCFDRVTACRLPLRFGELYLRSCFFTVYPRSPIYIALISCQFCA